MVSVELMKAWFDTVIDDIIRAVEDTLARVSDTGNTVDYMLIVGGFGGSPYLIAKLREAFSNQVGEVVCPGVPSQAVLKGKTPLTSPLPPPGMGPSQALQKGGKFCGLRFAVCSCAILTQSSQTPVQHLALRLVVANDIVHISINVQLCMIQEHVLVVFLLLLLCRGAQ